MEARQALNVAATSLGMTIVLGIVAALVLVGRWWPEPGAIALSPVAVEVAAGRTNLVCPGGPRLVGDGTDFSFDSEFDPESAERITVVEGFAVGRSGQPVPTGRYLPSLDASSQLDAIALEPARALSASLAVAGVEGPGLLQAEPLGGMAALVAGATLARSDGGDLRGLAAARCLEPMASGWLVAGSTELGSSSRLVFDNAGDTAATVRLEAWGPVGAVELGQAASVLVPARSERAVLLEASAANQQGIVVRMTVEGGQVAAFVQASALSGFVPAGVDLSGPTVEPSATVRIPGILLDETDIDATDPSLIRVVNAGVEPANVKLRLLDEAGETTVPGAESRVVEPGTVSDISLAGVPAGAYAAELVADQPVTAAAMLARVGGPSADDPDQQVVDRAWIPAAPSLRTSLIALPSLGDAVSAATIVVTNPSADAVDLQVRVVRAAGALSEARIVPVPPRATVVLEGDELAGAVGVELNALDATPDEAAPSSEADESAAAGAGPDGAGGPIDPGEPPTLVAAAVLTAEAADGTLITAIGAQPDLEAARTVVVRLPNR